MNLSQYLADENQAPETKVMEYSKEEYAALKKQEREEIWAMVDMQAQEIFRDGESLKGFLDFMAQCNPQKTANLLLLYSQNPELTQVRTMEKWNEEGKYVKGGSQGYYFMAGQQYEKDGIMEQGYRICKAYDVSQIRTRQPEPEAPKPMGELMKALLTKPEVKIRISDTLPEKVNAQYIPNQRTIYVRDGMGEMTTFHSISKEMACAELDRHDGKYHRQEALPQAYCAAYVVAQKFGLDVSGFDLGRVCAMQEHGGKDPQELRAFVGGVRSAAYAISRHMDRNMRLQEQEIIADDFTVADGKAGKGTEEKGTKKSTKDNDTKTKKQPER